MLPRLSKEDLRRLSVLQFKPVAAAPNTFIGVFGSQITAFENVLILTVIPLKMQADKFVFTLTVNGASEFDGLVGTMEDFKLHFETSLVWRDMDTWLKGSKGETVS